MIYTDIVKMGFLRVPILPPMSNCKQMEGLRVVASGGITYEREIEALRDLGVYGAIVGKALYVGKLSLVRVLSIAKGEAVEC